MGTSSAEFELVEATIPDIHSALLRGELTVHELVEQYLARIDAYDESLDAVLTVNERALDRADRLDDRFETEGFAGPLHGVPVLLKDNVNTAGIPTTAGSPVLQDLVPEEDATIVQRLRDAGAVILAKTNLGEFARSAQSTLGGHPRNPYATDRTPNGSSSGTGVAIAANLGVLGIGSDTGGSVRNPSACTNLVGLRPTLGVLSRSGLVPVSPTLDTPGPMTRTVRDAAAMMDVMAGYDPTDTATARPGSERRPGSFSSQLTAISLSDVHVGVLRSLFRTDADAEGGSAATDQVSRVVDEALADLRKAGASVTDPVPLPFDYGDRRGDVITISQFEFEDAMNDYLASLDDPPVGSLAEIAAASEFPHESVRQRVEGGMAVDTDDPEERLPYLETLRDRSTFRDEMLRTMSENGLDALVYPTHSWPPVEIGERQPGRNTRVSPIVDLPALTVPAGFTPEHGLPVGLEFLGHPFGERRLLAIGYQFEQATRHRRPPAQFGPVVE